MDLPVVVVLEQAILDIRKASGIVVYFGTSSCCEVRLICRHNLAQDTSAFLTNGMAFIFPIITLL